MFVCIVGTQSKIIYTDANDKIEQITKLFAQAMFVSTIIFMIPPLLYSMVSYYVLNLGTESFILFGPAWFVLLAYELKKKKW